MINNVFDRLAPFIQDYIYRNNWNELRPIQVATCDVFFNTKKNILLAATTASGKTEAAFLPVLTDLYENGSTSVGVLYISPLKALINDQFKRIYDLLDEIDIPVTKWHGDVDQNSKSKLLKNPKGVLQITPESLEAMLMKNRAYIVKLFSDLKYIIIDEVHYFMNSERGIQLLCIIERVQKIIGKIPRRIGLSATLGDYKYAENWLSSGTNNYCITPIVDSPRKKIALWLEYIKIENNKIKNGKTINDYYNLLYESSLNKKCIIFSNSKSEVEDNISHLKKISKIKNTDDIYYTHHANISKSLREYTEQVMKDDNMIAVTGATVTLELGIDIGNLDTIIQVGTPYSVSSFVQRLGRSGRRGNSSQMLFIFKEEVIGPLKEFYENVNYEFLLCISIVQLYIEEKWIEPILDDNMLPYSLLYHQTMSYTYSVGSVLPKELASNILTLTPFKNITADYYKKLLKFMIEKKQLEIDEDGLLIIGSEGEKITNHYNFYSIFETELEYSVKSGSKDIGTVQISYKIGDKFLLAGINWQVTDIDDNKYIIYVKKVSGSSSNAWRGNSSINIHTKVMKKIKDILSSNEEYKYLSEDAINELNTYRNLFRKSNALNKKIINLENGRCLLFYWVGTKQLLALQNCLLQNGIYNKLIVNSSIPVCIEILSGENIELVLKKIKSENPENFNWIVDKDSVKNAKYNEYVPTELLNQQYIVDCYDIKDMQKEM